jgi:PAS domain S-box-containing protein
VSRADTTTSTALRELKPLPAKPPRSANRARPDALLTDREVEEHGSVEEAPGSLDDLLWRDPAHAVSGMLHVISANLGGDLVVWTKVDKATGLVTLVDLADPIAPAHVLADLIQRSGAVSPNSLSARVAEFGQSLFVPQLDLADYPSDAFPEPWPAYLESNPIHGLIVVPIPLDDAQTGVLLVARRTTDMQYTKDDLRFVESGARRLAGGSASAPAADEIDAGNGVVRRWAARQLRRLRPRELLLGACLPGFTTAALWTLDDAAKYRPGVLLLLGCVVAAVVAGARAAALAGVLSTVALWWAFTPVTRSWTIASQGDLFGVILFAVAVSGLILLEIRLEKVRESERLERQLSETLLDQSPIAMAVFDKHLRYQRVNRPMAEMNGFSPAEHVGLRPGDLSPVAGQLYEHLLQRVRDSGQAITDHDVTILMPEVGFERHWKVSYQPLRDGGSEVVGVGAAVTDVTHEIVSRRHAERLLQLSESLTTALDEQRIAECVSSFLIDTFQGRAMVALRDQDALVVAALAGFSDVDATRLLGSRMMLGDEVPMAEAARTNKLVALQSPADFDRRYPELRDTPFPSHDQASLSMPLRADPTGFAVGAMHIGWAAPRPITEAMATLAGTVSSLVTLALARIIATQDAHDVEFRHALDAMLDDVVIGRAVRDDNGEIVDFVIEYVNSHDSSGARRGSDVRLGQLIGEIHPDWRGSGMLDRFRDVVNSGIPYQGHRVQYADPPKVAGGSVEANRRQAFWTIQVGRFGDGYISSSRDVTDIVLAEEATRAASAQAAAERTAIGLLQAAALPTTLPVLPGLRIAAVYEPADASQPVGGDWYDVFALDGDRVALVIADVAGHGHGAAVFMVQVRNVFRAIAAEHTEPDDVLIRANNVTARLNDPDGPFVTCCYAVLDVAAGTLRWAQAGHFSPLLVSANGTSTYLAERPGAPLALYEGEHYESSTVDVGPGDRVLLFTDGLVERRREHLDIGLARLAQLAAWNSRLPPQAFVETLAASVTQRFDDLAMVCVDFVGS